MKFEEKVMQLRKNHGFSQEELAEKVGVSRQAILFGVSVDRLIKEEDDCNIRILQKEAMEDDGLRAFIVRAAKSTYAAKAKEGKPFRPASHDFSYKEGEYLYIDSYVGSGKFSGEEICFISGKPVWSMNYCGRVIGQPFSGDFLKEALLLIPKDKPFRGPGTYQKGEYSYHCTVNGEFSWFQGYEEIYYEQDKIYELYFHGGMIE